MQLLKNSDLYWVLFFYAIFLPMFPGGLVAVFFHALLTLPVWAIAIARHRKRQKYVAELLKAQENLEAVAETPDEPSSKDDESEPSKESVDAKMKENPSK